MASPYLLESIDVVRLLGPNGALNGISTRQRECLDPWKETVKDAALAAAMQGKLKAELAAQLRELATNSSAAAGQLGSVPILQLVSSPHIDSPAFREVDRLLANTLSRYLLRHDGSRFCACGRPLVEGRPGEAPLVGRAAAGAL